MSRSTTFPCDSSTCSWGDDRILACRRAPARALSLLAVSATVLALAPPAASAADGSMWATPALRFEAAGGELTVAGIGAYRGTIEVRRNGSALAVVNDVGLEDYVRGIDEVPPSWPDAALQAQAIAARTYAVNKAAATDVTPWRTVGADICATSTCQVYKGLGAERRAAGYGWPAAVQATAGRVLLAGGRPILSSYSATANGVLAMSQNGAYDMAVQGRTAPEILEAYYGIRPTAAPPGLLPATVRVALATSTRSVRITAAAPVRVVAVESSARATAGPGDWVVTAAESGLRLVAADGAAPAAAPSPAEGGTAEAATTARHGTRVLIAATPRPSLGLWPLAAGALLLSGAGATLTARTRWPGPGAGRDSRVGAAGE